VPKQKQGVKNKLDKIPSPRVREDTLGADENNAYFQKMDINSAIAQFHRKEDWKNEVHEALIWGFRIGVALVLMALLACFVHLVFPDWGWLTEAQFLRLKDLVFGALAAIVFDSVKRKVAST
jgi:hypothetical protein